MMFDNLQADPMCNVVVYQGFSGSAEGQRCGRNIARRLEVGTIAAIVLPPRVGGIAQ